MCVLRALAAQFITKNNKIVESTILTLSRLHGHVPSAASEKMDEHHVEVRHQKGTIFIKQTI